MNTNNTRPILHLPLALLAAKPARPAASPSRPPRFALSRMVAAMID